MSIASILCVDGELDVHDTASAAVAAAIERHRDEPTARIGVAVGELEVGDPLGFAKRLSEIAEPGAILVSDTVRRAIPRDDRRFVDLGAISTTGHLDRVHVFELDGARECDRTMLSLELSTTQPALEAERQEYDRRVWSSLAKHRGFVQRSHAFEYLSAFGAPLDAFRAALAIQRALLTHDVRVHVGIERGHHVYVGDQWIGDAGHTAQRIRSTNFQQLASTMAAVEAAGSLVELGLVIEVIEEVVQRGVRDPVRVAQLRVQ